jgi:hypothetical protein
MLENLSESFHHVWLYLGCYLYLNKNRGLDRRNDDGGSEEIVLKNYLPQALCEM